MHRTSWLVRRASSATHAGASIATTLSPSSRSIFPSLAGAQRRLSSANLFENFTEDTGNENLDVETPDVQDPIYRNVQRVRAQQAYADEIKTTKFRSARELLELLDEIQDGWWSKDIIIMSLSKLISLARRGDRLKAEVGDSLRLSPDTRLMSLADGSSTLAGTEELGAEARYAHVLRAAAEQVSAASSEWSDKELVAVLRLLKPAAQEADVAFAGAVCDAISARMLAAPEKWGAAQLTATLQSAATAPGVPLDFISLCSEQLSSKLSLPADQSVKDSAVSSPSLSALSAAVVAVRDAFHFKALAGELGALQGGGQLPPGHMEALQAEAAQAVFRQLEADGTAEQELFDGHAEKAIVPRTGDSPAVSQARVHALALREMGAALQLPAVASVLPALPSPSWRAVSSMQPVHVWHLHQEHDDALGVEQQRSLRAFSSPSNAADVLQVARFAQSCNELAEAAVRQLAGRSSNEWKNSLSTAGKLKAVTAVAELLPNSTDAGAAVSAASSVLSHDLPDLDESSCAQCLAAVTRVLDTGLAQELARAPGDVAAVPSPVQGSLQLLLSVCHRLSVELQAQLEAVGDRTQLTAHERRRLGKKNKQGLAHLVQREQLHYTRGDVVQLVNYSADALGSLQRWLADAVPGMSEHELLDVGARVRPSSTSDSVELAAAALVSLRAVLAEPLLAAAESHSARLAPGELLSVLGSYRAAGLEEGALEALAVPAGTAAATGPVDVAVAVANEYWRSGYGGELQWVDPNATQSASEQEKDTLRATVKRLEAARSGDLASTLSALRELDTGPAIVSKGDAVLQALQVRVQRETPDMESRDIAHLLGLMSDMGLRHHATFAAAASQLHERLQHWPPADILRFLSSLPPANEFEGDASHAVKFSVMAASDALVPAALSVYRGGSLPEIAGLSQEDARSKLADAFKRAHDAGMHDGSALGLLEPWAAAAAARVVAQHGVVNSAFMLSAVQAALRDGASMHDDSLFLDTFSALNSSFSTLESGKYGEAAEQGTAAAAAMQRQRAEDLAWHGHALSAAQNAWLRHSKHARELNAGVVAASLHAHVAAVICGAMQPQDVLPFLHASPGMIQAAARSGDTASLNAASRSMSSALQLLSRFLADGPLLLYPEGTALDALVAAVAASRALVATAPSATGAVLSVAAVAAEAASRSSQVDTQLLGSLSDLLQSAQGAVDAFVHASVPVDWAAAAAAGARCAGYLSTMDHEIQGVRSAYLSSVQCGNAFASAATGGAGVNADGEHALRAIREAASAGEDETTLDTAALAWLDTLDSVSALALSSHGGAAGSSSELHQLLNHSALVTAACLGCARLPDIEDVHGVICPASFGVSVLDGQGVLEAFGGDAELRERLGTLLHTSALGGPTAAVHAAYAALTSHQLAGLLQREHSEDEDMTQLSSELATVHDTLQAALGDSPAASGSGSWAAGFMRAQAEVALARSIATAAEAAGLTSHGMEDADDALPSEFSTSDEQTDGPHSPTRGFAGKLQSMFDSFVQSGEETAANSDEPSDMAGAADAGSAPEWCAESHPTEGLLAASTTITPDSPAGIRIGSILVQRSARSALRKAPADSESLALMLQHAAALAGMLGSETLGAGAEAGIENLTQHALHVLAELQGEHIETEAVLAAVPAVRAAAAECPDGQSKQQLVDAMQEALLFCAEQDADSSDATLALQNCASLASVACDLPSTSPLHAARWAEAVKESLHTALAHAPEWEAPKDSLGEGWSADVDALLSHGVRHVGPRPLRMRRLLQWYLEEQKLRAAQEASTASSTGVQHLQTTPRGAPPAFVHGGEHTTQAGRAVRSAAREVRETASALQDGLVPLTPPVLRLLADMVGSPAADERGREALLAEVQHCTRLCLPALWANLHDGSLPPEALVDTCGSLLQLSGAGVSVRAPYALRPPRFGNDPPSTAAGSGAEGNMLVDTAHFMLASVLQRHASHVQQSVVASDPQTAATLGAGAAAAIGKAPALALSFADRVGLLQCVSQAPDVLADLPSALRLALWGMRLADDDGDCIGTAALPAATDALAVVRGALGEPSMIYVDAACGNEVLQLSQAFSSLLLNTAGLLAPPPDTASGGGAQEREDFLDNVSADNLQDACVHGLAELAALLQAVQAISAPEASKETDAATPSPAVQQGIAGCLAACLSGFAEQLQQCGAGRTRDSATLEVLAQLLAAAESDGHTGLAAAAAALRAAW